MAHIFLRGLEQNCYLQLDELQRFPDSLLANMVRSSTAADTATDSAPEDVHSKRAGLEHIPTGASKAIVLDLGGTPDSPLKNWPLAAVVTHSMYK